MRLRVIEDYDRRFSSYGPESHTCVLLETRRVTLLAFASTSLFACLAPTGEPSAQSGDELVATSKADHSCEVVLRTAKVRFDQPFATDSHGFPWFVVEASVDVAKSALAQGSVPEVQWGPGGTIPATSGPGDDAPIAVAGARPGFQRFAFRLTHNTIPANGQDETFLSQSSVALIPLLVQGHGRTKLFDHNRRRGATDQYSLFQGDPTRPTSGDRFTIADDAHVCR